MAEEAGGFQGGPLGATDLPPWEPGTLTVQSYMEATTPGSWSLGSKWGNPAPRPRARHKLWPLGGRSEPQTSLRARYPPPNPEGGPAGSGHSGEAPRGRLCLALQRSPCLWRLQVGPTLTRAQAGVVLANPKLPTPHLEVPGPQGPYEGMPPELCSGHSQLTPGPLWTFPTLGTTSSKELPPTSCLGPQPNCTRRELRPGSSFHAVT